MKTYNKLVRDRIPEIIAANGQHCTIEKLSEADYIRHLEAKLDEECAEYHADRNAEELCDILEVVYALAAADGITAAELEDMRRAKSDKRGGFSERILLKQVTESGEQ